MVNEKKYKTRHEFKYICHENQLMLIKNNIDGIVKLDSHVTEKGFYIIRSLYFDDYYHTCYYENQNGTDPREKFRIRIYNGSDKNINLELKRKCRSKTMKESCTMTRQQVEDIINNKLLDITEDMPTLLRKFCLLQQTRLLKPSVIVEYNRVPFVYKDGNVRITFDKNINSSNDYKNFFNDKMEKRPIMACNQHVLEVKYDEILPDPINRSLEIGQLQQTSFSKFYLCKRYQLGGLI